MDVFNICVQAPAVPATWAVLFVSVAVVVIVAILKGK